MDKLNSCDLIEKIGNRQGISWRLTEKGNFILKESMRGSVNVSQRSNQIRESFSTKFPIRLHQVAFAFKINFPPMSGLDLDWKKMRNGVSKTIIKKIDENVKTGELIRSPNDGKSVLILHMHTIHTFDYFKEIIRLYEVARIVAQIVAERLGIEVSTVGGLIKKPHLAFESDLVSSYLASYERPSIKTSKGEIWIDESHGVGELETNDVDYAYKYLIMPEIIMEIFHQTNQITKRLASPFSTSYHYITHNN